MLNVKQNVEEVIDPYAGLGASDVIDRGILDSNSYVLSGVIDSESIDSVVRWLIFENNKPTQHMLTLYVNSTGGYLDDAFCLIDMMRHTKHSIRTVGMGHVMSAAFLIFSSGTRGFRFIGKNANIMSHQFSDAIDGKHHDIKAYMKCAEYTNKRMVDLLKDNTGLDTATIKRKLLPPSDVWLTPEELIELNVADHIL
jgi:ATP-dependent Clp endopeptidase proteolytic subunit ClpP